MFLGTGMCMTMACMLIFSRLSVTVCGGTGVLIPLAHGAGDGTLGVTLPTTVGAGDGIGVTAHLGDGAVGTTRSTTIIGMHTVRHGAGAAEAISDVRVIVLTTVRLQHKGGTTGTIVSIPALASVVRL